MKTFFYRYWGLYYILFFLLLGLLIYALLWNPNSTNYLTTINELKYQLEECKNTQTKVDSSAKGQTIISPTPNIVNCDASVKSGGQGITTTHHELGLNSGTVIVNYEMQKVPDEITVYYDNNIVAQSNGLVQGEGKLQFMYDAKAGKPTFCIIRVSAPNDQTIWNYLLNCPQ